MLIGTLRSTKSLVVHVCDLKHERSNFISSGEFPKVDWGEFWDWLEDFPEHDRHVATCAFQKKWLQKVAQSFGDDYALSEFSELFVVSRFKDNALKGVNDVFMGSKNLLGQKLGIDPSEGYGKSVCLIMGDSELYYRYISNDENWNEQPPSEGVCLEDGCVQIVLHGSDVASIKNLLVHETTHAELIELCLPTWLSEGIALVMEDEICGQTGAQDFKRFDFVDYFAKHGLEDFISGASFEFSAEGIEASYQLAYRLVRYLWEFSKFTEFLQNAAKDESAVEMETYFGIGLEELYSVVSKPGGR